jgi:regulator of replication initiation timing
MDNELIAALEERVGLLLSAHAELKQRNVQLEEENSRLRADRSLVRDRIDVMLKRLESV